MSVPSPLSRPARRLDVSPLTEPVDAATLNAFAADAKATGKPWRRITTGLPRPGVGDVVSQLLPVVVPLVGLGFVLVVGGASLVSAVGEFTREAPFPLNLVIVGFLALILLGVLGSALRAVATIRALLVPRWWWEAAYRLTRFAAANDLRYGHDESVSYPGLIFGTGVERTAERRLSTTTGRRLEIGNYRYTVRGEKHDSVFGWGYVAIQLDRRLPHLLLDARANDRSVFGIRTSNLPVDLARDQRLSLGGEFDDKFTLYAPSNYGRDAFLIFTPDLMALFIDRLGAFDVEVVDDTMFVYGGRFDLLDPATYVWLQELVEVVVARTVRRTERYRDDFALLEAEPGQGRAVEGGAATGAATGRTLPATAGTQAETSVFALAGDGPAVTATNAVASGGRRLRRRRWTFSAVLGLLAVGYWLYAEVVAPLVGLPTLDG